MNLSKSTLLLLALAGIALLMFASNAAANPGDDDTWEGATEVYHGTPITATVTSQASGTLDEDWFKIYMTDGQVLKLFMASDPTNGRSGFDIWGPKDATNLLYRSRNNDITINNLIPNEADLFILRDGFYYIRVHVWDGDSSQYQLTVRVLVPPDIKDGDRIDNQGDPLFGRVMSSLWYKVWLDGGNKTAEMATATLTWSDDVNVHLVIYGRRDDYWLNLLNYSWSRNYDHSENVRWAASYSGFYYIKILNTKSTDPIIPEEWIDVFYTLTVDVLDSKWPADGNVWKDDAELIEIMTTVKGELIQAYDTYDWYKFYLKEGEYFSSIARFKTSNNMLATYWTFYGLYIYAHNGTLLGSDTSHNQDGSPSSSVTANVQEAPYTGLYYMCIATFDSYSGMWLTNDYTGGKLVNSAWYTMDILIPNRQVWVVDPPGEIRMDEDDEYTLDLNQMFWDPEGDDLSYGYSGGSSNFTFLLTRGNLTITPKPNWHGMDEIVVWAHDGRPSLKNSTKIILNVRSVPDPPVILPSAPNVVRIYEDEVNTTALDLTDVFYDVDEEDRFLIFSSDKSNNIQIEIQQASGVVTLWGIENYNGEETITFYATDSNNFRKSHPILIKVIATNDAPVAVGKIPRLNMKEGGTSSIDVGPYFEDIDGDDLYFYVIWDKMDSISFDNADSDPLNSWFDITTYEDPNFYGYVQLTFECYDRDRLATKDYEKAVQTAILEVENVNDAPRIDAVEPEPEITIEETESVVFKVEQQMIYDVDSTSFKWRWFVNEEEIVDVTTETFEFPRDPSYDDAGVYYIRCEVKDNLGEPANYDPEWTLTITNKNRAPNVYLISKDTSVEEGSDIRLRADGSDNDQDSLIFEWFMLDDKGREQSVGLGRDYTIDKPLLPGTYYFKCYVSDGQTNIGSETVKVEIQAHEFPPTIPGFGAFVLFGALIAGLAMATAMRRRT